MGLHVYIYIYMNIYIYIYIYIYTRILSHVGSSARQFAFKRGLAQQEFNSGKRGSDRITPPGSVLNSPAVGSMSPSLDPLTGLQSGYSSKFAGDRRSYDLVTEIALHLTASAGSGAAGINATEATMIGIGTASVLLEKSELLTSMLHHQLRQISLKAADPRRSQVIICVHICICMSMFIYK
jgi:hypothetical protein